jgi:hypothetical protein
MAYLNKAAIVVDAILTNRGRELLARGGVGNAQAFDIVKFAVADDEIDYGLYNVAHPNGTDSAGAIIENMPVVEATPDEQQIMRYKLVTLPSEFILDNGQVEIPSILNAGEVILGGSAPQDRRIFETSPTFTESYVLLIGNARLVRIVGVNGENLIPTPNANGSATITIAAGQVISIQKIKDGPIGETIATVFGQSTGATASFKITVS